MAANQGTNVERILTRQIHTLQTNHRQVLVRAIENICNIDAARMTFAQILDGVPTVALVNDGHPPLTLPESHPSQKEHQQLCAGVLNRLQQFRNDFNIENLPLDSQAMLAYQGAAVGSRLFNMRLIELTSRSIHQIAVEIASLDENLHKTDGLLTWTPPKSDDLFWLFSPNGPLPTWFHLSWYNDYKQYPNGSDDMIGYWAENLIIGGVVLFDRRHVESRSSTRLAGKMDPDAVYIHSERYDVTYRICKLLDTQKKEYLDFLQSDPAHPVATCPLPLGADKNNRDRVDPEEPIMQTGIYRDSWERLPLPEEAPDGRLRDVIYQLDYPTVHDWSKSHRRAKYRRDGSAFDDELDAFEDELDD